MPVDDFAEWVRVTFGLGDGPVTHEVGGRGAEGEVLRVQVAGGEFAVKRPFRALDVQAVAREASLLDHLATGGVVVPAHVRTADGHLVAEVPAALGGGSARVSHWVVGESVADRTSVLADRLGTLLAQLHRAAPSTDEQPRRWYTAMVPGDEWADLVERTTGQPWHDVLVGRQADLTAYAGVVDRAGPGTGPFVLGHCDLHPDNALLAPDGSLRALDWEDSGPLDPTRELAKALVQWHVLGDDVDEGAVVRTVAAYRAAGGQGRLADLTDFAMVLCSETNFLADQIRLVLDEHSPHERREQAHGEIRESLHGYLPTMGALQRVLDLASRWAPTSS